MDEDFAIMGDLGEGKYIVRMWAHDHVIDEEFTANDVSDLLDQINNRLDNIDASTANKKGTKGKKPGASDWSGQAIPITEEQGFGYKGRAT